MANVTGASLNPIFSRLNSAPEYHPLEADTFADWAVEAGDMVTVTRDGTSYKSPVHEASMNWRRGQEIQLSSTGKQTRDPVSRMTQRKYKSGGSGLRNDGYIHLYVQDQYNQLQSGLELTASSAYLYSKDFYKQMESGLKLTASSAHLYTQNMYNQMATGLHLSESTAILYAQSRTNRAYIVARINANGEGEALINANKVQITGNTTIKGMMRVQDGSLQVNGNIQAGLSGGNYIRGKELRLIGSSGSQGAQESILSYAALAKMIAKAEVSGNNLRLWTFDNKDSATPSITFSKATTLRGSWSSGVFTVTATGGESIFTSLTGGAGTWSGKTVTIPIYATIGTSGAVYNTGKTVQATYSGADVANIDLGEIAVSSYPPTGYEGATLLTQLPDAIKNNHNTYVWFKVKALDSNGRSLMTKSYYCASA